MKILFVADWRSIIARNWIHGIASLGHECRVLSSYPTDLVDQTIVVDEVPIALASLRPQRVSLRTSTRNLGTSAPAEASSWARGSGGPQGLVVPFSRPARRLLSGDRAVRAKSSLRRRAAPYDVTRHLPAASRVVAAFRPDLVHALRIPFEGIFATRLVAEHRTVVSIWGNDLTLYAPTTNTMRRQTRRALAATDGLIADCERDIVLARTWGYPPRRPTIVLPGSAGIELATDVQERRAQTRARLGVGSDVPMVFSPRGPRVYLRLSNLCRAVPKVLRLWPQAVFVFAQSEHGAVERLAMDLGVADSCRFLPNQTADQMLDLFSAADVFVSPSVHDGTPNTLIEGMSVGCFPIAGATASIREWITDGENGLLCDPEQTTDISSQIVAALANRDLRENACTINKLLVANRAERTECLRRADAFYQQVCQVRPGMSSP